MFGLPACECVHIDRPQCSGGDRELPDPLSTFSGRVSPICLTIPEVEHENFCFVFAHVSRSVLLAHGACSPCGVRLTPCSRSPIPASPTRAIAGCNGSPRSSTRHRSRSPGRADGGSVSATGVSIYRLTGRLTEVEASIMFASSARSRPAARAKARPDQCPLWPHLPRAEKCQQRAS
jgi:hypothetical protein